MTNYIILLPPSEGKSKEGEDDKIFRVVKNLKKYNYFIHLDIERELIHSKVLETISSSAKEDLEKVFELKGNNLNEAIEVQLDLLNKRCKEAIQRFSGTMFKAIDYSTLNKEQKDNFNASTVFIDGMFGLLKAKDLIPDYKLKINSKLKDLNVQKFWKERLAPTFPEIFKGKIIIDLLPEAHRKVVDYSSAKEVYKISFSELKNGKVKNTGHFSKLYKGEFIRELTRNETIDEDFLINFKHSEGHKFSKEHSTQNEFVYLKK